MQEDERGYAICTALGLLKRNILYETKGWKVGLVCIYNYDASTDIYPLYHSEQ